MEDKITQVFGSDSDQYLCSLWEGIYEKFKPNDENQETLAAGDQ